VSNKADYLLYEKSAQEYDRVRFGGVAGNWGHQRQIDILRGLVGDWQGKKVLEIGCGTGRITEMLVRWGATVTATDISKEMLEVARARLDGVRGMASPEFRVMSVFDIDIDLRSYDLVIMINVLGRLSNAHQAIHEIALRISADARFIFTFPCLTSILLPIALMINRRGKSLSRDVTSQWYSPKAVERFCRSAGLEIIRFRGNHYVPVPRLLFPTLPLFWACDKVLGRFSPRRCPSVFAECRTSGAAIQDGT